MSHTRSERPMTGRDRIRAQGVDTEDQGRCASRPALHRGTTLLRNGDRRRRSHGHGLSDTAAELCSARESPQGGWTRFTSNSTSVEAPPARLQRADARTLPGTAKAPMTAASRRWITYGMQGLRLVQRGHCAGLERSDSGCDESVDDLGCGLAQRPQDRYHGGEGDDHEAGQDTPAEDRPRDGQLRLG